MNGYLYILDLLKGKSNIKYSTNSPHFRILAENSEYNSLKIFLSIPFLFLP